MPTMRRTWQTPTLGEVTVRSALFGPTLQTTDMKGPPGEPVTGPVGPNGQAFGPPPPGPAYGPQPGPTFGPPVRGPVMWGPPSPAPLQGPVLFGPAIFGPSVPSDVRLKENVRQIGTTAHGLPLYTFSYRGQVEVYEGVMAQDVLAVRPDAVTVDADGYYRVNYEQLGVAFRRVH